MVGGPRYRPPNTIILSMRSPNFWKPAYFSIWTLGAGYALTLFQDTCFPGFDLHCKQISREAPLHDTPRHTHAISHMIIFGIWTPRKRSQFWEPHISTKLWQFLQTVPMKPLFPMQSPWGSRGTSSDSGTVSDLNLTPSGASNYMEIATGHYLRQVLGRQYRWNPSPDESFRRGTIFGGIFITRGGSLKIAKHQVM